jgi:hypothetical protein
VSKRLCGHDSARSDGVYVCFPCKDENEAATRDAVWNAAIEAAEAEAFRLGREASAEVERCNPEDSSGHRNYWLGKATMAGEIRAAIRALKREAK